MKNCLLVLAFAALTALESFGQGSVIFSNAGGQPLFRVSVGARVPIGSAYQAELMYAPDGTPLQDFDNTAIRIGASASFGPVAGFFSGGGRTVNSLQPAGGFGLFQVRVWNATQGNSFHEVIFNGNGEVGESFVIRVDTANPLTGEPPTSIGQALTWQAFYPISAVPEPSVIALGVISTGALLLLRRRK